MKRFLAILILILLSLPFIFNVFSYKNGELSGFVDKREKPIFSFKGFDELKYQNDLEKYAQQKVPFSNIFTRLSNEIKYRVFRY